MASFIEITAENFDQYISQEDMPVIVNFEAPWSTACLILKPNLAEALDDNQERAIFGSVNTDQQTALTERFSIISIPTTLVFWKGQLVKEYLGIQEADIFTALIDQLLAPPKDMEDEAPIPTD